MTSAWEELWASFRGAFDALNAEVRPEHAGYVVQAGWYANEAFPFRGWASYSPASAPADEELVVSLDFHRRDGAVRGKLDLCRADGEVLAEEPMGEPFEETDTAVAAAARNAAAAVRRFLIAHRDLVAFELRRAAGQ